MQTLISLLVFSVLGCGLWANLSAREINPTDFAIWLVELRQEAIDQGVSVKLAHTALDNLTPSAFILSFDRRQPELSLGFWDYYARGVSANRVKTGKQKKQKNQSLLARISRKYGVQPRFLLAFWGLESDFGRIKGDHDLVQALVTLAYDPRRSDFFRTELIQLLKIIDAHHLTLKEARGSWAGAFGHTQFMPSTFAAFGVDGNQDGKIHLINSHEDALYSAANYLRKLGWDDEKTWGREVTIPKGFDYCLAQLERKKTLSEWQKLGITTAKGAALPRVELKASLIVPSGSGGPAFLVYDNFHRIMRWNRSIFFALNVGLLSDAIAERARLQAQPPRNYTALKTQQIQQIQQALDQRGFNTGTPDGVIGQQTRQAIRDFQSQNGLTPDGYPSMATRKLLAVSP
ncbi:MAG: lytic murein transglycosylase [Alphaproteobacteria bacterium]|nr:lytic murein transglycosylase [Alphaproteobacteria bacterium]